MVLSPMSRKGLEGAHEAFVLYRTRDSYYHRHGFITMILIRIKRNEFVATEISEEFLPPRTREQGGCLFVACTNGINAEISGWLILRRGIKGLGCRCKAEQPLTTVDTGSYIRLPYFLALHSCAICRLLPTYLQVIRFQKAQVCGYAGEQNQWFLHARRGADK